MNIVTLNEQVIRLAQTVQPASLRSIDALHLATALYVGGIDAVITYDQRLAEAATANGLTVLAPGR